MNLLLDPSVPLPPTQKLFLDDPRLAECEATVLFVQGNLVVLDRTVFYAESGGQAPDPGWINDIPVVDVQKSRGQMLFIKRTDIDVPPVKVETILVHRLAVPAPFQVGQSVHLKIDWPVRYQTSRMHSAAHFLYHASRTIYHQNGVKPITQGCAINAERARFDFFPKLEPVDLWAEVGTLANDLISHGGRITMEPDPLTKEVCYWTCGEVIIPCGGTHVSNAAEIGPLRIQRSRKGKSIERVYGFLIGSEEAGNGE